MEDTMMRQLSRERAIHLYEALEHRHSMRSYTGEKLPKDLKNKLVEFIEEGWEPYPGARTRMVLLEGKQATSKIFKGLIGSYGAVQNAPAVLLMIANIDDPYFYEATGYMGEQLVLYATYLGFDTCWVGGFFRPEVAAKMGDLQPNERVLAVTPIGYAKKDGMSSLYEGIFKFGTKRGKRKSLEEISAIEGGEPPRWYDRALQAVQVAPSSYNDQPWHLMHHQDGTISMSSVKAYKDKVPVFAGAPNSSRLCCGIGMLHFKVATRAIGIEGRWLPEEEQSNPIAVYFVPENTSKS